MVGPGRPRDVGRNYLSGYGKRKAKDEKEKKEREVLAKTPKLNNFFSSGGSSSHEAGESSKSSDSSPSLVQDNSENEKANERESQNERENADANENETANKTANEDEDENENASERESQNGIENTNENETANEDENENANENETANETANENENENANETANENELNHSEDDNENQSTSSVNLITSFDLGTWPSVIDRNNQDHLICRGSLDCQHMNGDFKESKRFYENEKKNRFCSKSVFIKIHKLTKESLKRNWLCYSPSKGCLFCFPCKVMNKFHERFSENGFNDWKNATVYIEQHEHSLAHREALTSITSWKMDKPCIDLSLTRAFEKEKEYWQKILTRIVEVIKFLSIKGLPFQGDNETIGSVHNGNYLGILELLAKFDDLLKEHLENYAQKGKGKTSYLSHQICDEFVKLLADAVLSKIVKELKEAKYFSISLDSTPDLSHVDQLTFILRYVLPSGPVERFVKFLDMEGHGASQMLDSLMKFLIENEINILNCRGQSYDNATNMAGPYNGLQAKVKNLCKYAEFVPCFGHSLNLVGSCAAESCPQAVLFFTFLASLFSFFSVSTYRWKILMAAINEGLAQGQALTLKRLSGTRWAERADATQALYQSYSKVVKLLEKIAVDPAFKADARLQAAGFAKTMKKLETCFMIIFWNKVLQQFQKTSASLQAEDLCLNTAYCMLESLSLFVESLQGDFLSLEAEAKTLTDCETYQRQRRRNPRFVDSDNQTAPDNISSFEDSTFKVILHCLKSELHKRQNAYKKLSNLFGFLKNLEGAKNEEIRKCSQSLVMAYPEDLEEHLSEELIQFSALLKTDLGACMDKKMNKEVQM